MRCVLPAVLLAWTAVLRAAEPSLVQIEGVPFVRQKPDFCGEACAAMYLQKLGIKADQDYVFDQSRLDPLLGRGCYTKELNDALARIGFKTGAVWTNVASVKLQSGLEGEFAALVKDLKAGVPSIVCMHYSERENASEHFRLILGYDREADEILYHEPAEDDGAGRRMSKARLFKTWPLKYEADKYTLIRMRLEPGRLDPKAGTSRTFTDADYALHVRALKKRLPSREFSILIQKPFVVVGDEPLADLKAHAKNTIQWSVDRLKAQYFEKDPAEILDIWLFRDSVSYEENAGKLFGSKPTTPYGYFSRKDKALVMNIGTGGGTLVHEIVHPFIAANFETCPSWFNEGLASLYEACQDRDGKISGMTNWRLKGLQTAIEKKKVPSFETLCSTTTSEFYDSDRGTNYSQARYLCYYLQEKGLLQMYYREFRKAAKDDPSGYLTLQTVLGEEDMADFKERWEAWVMKLTAR